jgi:type I restriction-modification system DNA methylase subunit
MDELAKDDEKIKEFYYLLCKKHLIGETKESGSLIKKLLDDEYKRQAEIQDTFYKKYKALREEVVNDILEKNNITPDAAIAKAQKLFDRLLFIRFCEDNNLITKPLQKIEAGKALGLSLWEALKVLFTSIDKGNPPHIHKFNGGLFANDQVFNEIKVETKLVQRLIDFLSVYHFQNDISVNILGHIFEQSITDLEALKAGLHDESHNKKDGKRKKDGIFYTPEYITKYIVEEAVGGWLKERKDELKLDELTPQEVPAIKPKKWINPNQELINRYKLYAKILKQIKVLDPACGSGAFLVEVFNYLEGEWLSLSATLRGLGDEDEMGLFNYQSLYRYILQNNIYGVDLNSESVQITKLSLWLKTANNTDELTTLDNNIKVGNSLIDEPAIAGDKAFKWQEEFKEVFKEGGFDVIVGNPPYVRHNSESIYNQFYKWNTDLYLMFYERVFKCLIKHNSFFGFITPRYWTVNQENKTFREYLLNEITLISISETCPFEGVDTENIVTIIKNCKSDKGEVKIYQDLNRVISYSHNVNKLNCNKNEYYEIITSLNAQTLEILNKRLLTS